MTDIVHCLLGFGFPSAHDVMTHIVRHCLLRSQVVIVAPSQELAMQIVRVAQSLLPAQARTMVQQCIGGANPKYQLVGTG
jgi:superfamily II DNA/RNA helicase